MRLPIITLAILVLPLAAGADTVGNLCRTITAARAGNATAEQAKAAFTEIARLGVFANRDMDAIARGQIYIGMPEAAMVCATGNFNYGIHTTQTAAGVSRQYVLGDGTYNPRRYVYTENGVVTAIQD